MKELRIVGENNIHLAKSLLNVQGEDFAIKFSLPIFVQILGISLTEIKEDGYINVLTWFEGNDGVKHHIQVSKTGGY